MDTNSNALFHSDVATRTQIPETTSAAVTDFLWKTNDSKSLPCGQLKMHPLTDTVTRPHYCGTRLNSGATDGYQHATYLQQRDSNMYPDLITSLSTSGVLLV